MIIINYDLLMRFNDEYISVCMNEFTLIDRGRTINYKLYSNSTYLRA